jgi:integrase
MKHSVKFDLFQEKGASECRPIRIRIAYAGRRLDLRLGYSVEPENWDANMRRVRSGTKNKFKQPANTINRAITKCETFIEKMFTQYELLENRYPAIEELRRDFNAYVGKENKALSIKTFFDVFDEFVSATGEKNNWEKATYTKFGTIRRYLFQFNEKLSLNTFTDATMQDFVSSLHSAGLVNTTVRKYTEFVLWFIRWAQHNGYYKGTTHQTFRQRLKGTTGEINEPVYLTWEELIRLYEFEFPTNKLSFPIVRDIFCFCCFTGLRYSDVAKLRRSDVKETFIRVVTKKTVEGLTIELNKYSRAILDKYKNVKLRYDLALPVISGQKMNEHLKEIGELVGIDEPVRRISFKRNERIEIVSPKYALLTTHCGRRTFIVNALYLGIPAEVVMKWTGHSDYDAMKPYVKIVDALKEESMRKFDLHEPPKKTPKKNEKKGKSKNVR